MKQLTVVTTTYKSSKYIHRYFEGILNLNHLDQLQVILVANLPDPIEKQTIRDYTRQYPDLFRVIELNQRETVGASMNRGFALADTPYASYLDVDDLRVSDSFDRQIATLEDNPDVDYTYGDFMVVKSQGERDGCYVSKPEFDKVEFTRECHATPALCFRTDLIKRIGGFDEQFRVATDFDFQIRAAFNCKFKKTPGLLYYYTSYAGSGSASSNRSEWAIAYAAIMLRYRWYDKVESLNHYPYVKQARRYRLVYLLINGAWQHLGRQVPNYDAMMTERESARLAFEKKYHRWLIRNYATWPSRATKKTVRWMLAQFGLLDMVRGLRDGRYLRTGSQQ